MHRWLHNYIFQIDPASRPLLGYLVITVTLSLQSFCYFKKLYTTAIPLIWPDFCGRLKTGLTGFHIPKKCNLHSHRSEFMKKSNEEDLLSLHFGGSTFNVQRAKVLHKFLSFICFINYYAFHQCWRWSLSKENYDKWTMISIKNQGTSFEEQ